MIYLYLASLVFGGVLLGTSLVLGGHDDADGDFGGDVDADADLDIEMDVDADADVDVGGHDTDIGGFDFFLWPLRSMRFWTFFTAFFGMTGLALRGLDLAGSIPALVIALVMGMGSGFGASWVIRHLSGDTTGLAKEASDYIGKSAKVVVPVRRNGVGKIRVRIGSQLVDVLATTDEEALTSEDEVIVIEMDGTRARVARLTTD